MSQSLENIEISVCRTIWGYEGMEAEAKGRWFFFTLRNKCFTMTISQGTEILEKMKR